MSKNRFNEEDLHRMGLYWDGKQYVKIKNVATQDAKLNTSVVKPTKVIDHANDNIRVLKLELFGIPMAKQSVRSTRNGLFYQPKESDERKQDYIRQIKQQLPKDFKPFTKQVFITKFHCIYPPLKSFHKKKGKMDAIRNGEIFYKNTQPDLIDNLKKLVFDCFGKDKKTKIPLVLDNDGIIVGEDNTRKYYGTGGMIIIEMKGE